MALAWQDGKKTDGSPSPELSGTLADEIPMTTRAAELIEARGDEAIRAHCLRVATWASELASAIGLSESDRNLVEQAAIAAPCSRDSVGRPGAHVACWLKCIWKRKASLLVSDDVRSVLETLWGRRPIADPAMGKIVAVLEISDDFDQFFESEPLLATTRWMNARTPPSKP